MKPNINQLYKTACSGGKPAEEELFSSLLDRFRYSIHLRIGNQQDAEEIVQDTLMIVAREFKQINIESSFAAWVHGVVNNRILAYIKKKKTELARTADLLPEEPSHLPVSSNSDFKSRLLDCLRKMREAKVRHVRILNLHYQGYKTDEICSRMDMTENALYVLLSRARKMLAGCLDNGEINA